MFFISLLLFSFLRYLILFPNFLAHVGKRLDKTVKVNFKVSDVVKWKANNYNTHIVQNLKK